MARTLYCIERCSVNLVTYEPGQVLEHIADDLAELLLNAAPASFTDQSPEATVEAKVLDEPPADTMVKRAPVKK